MRENKESRQKSRAKGRHLVPDHPPENSDPILDDAEVKRRLLLLAGKSPGSGSAPPSAACARNVASRSLTPPPNSASPRAPCRGSRPARHPPAHTSYLSLLLTFYQVTDPDRRRELADLAIKTARPGLSTMAAANLNIGAVRPRRARARPSLSICRMSWPT
jgi:hypothetical protein